MKYILIGFGLLLVAWLIKTWLEMRNVPRGFWPERPEDYAKGEPANRRHGAPVKTTPALRREILGKLLRRMR